MGRAWAFLVVLVGCASPPPEVWDLEKHGDWIVDTDLTLDRKNVTLIDGTLVVRGTGRLIVRDSTLWIPRLSVGDAGSLQIVRSKVGPIELSGQARLEAEDSDIYEVSVDERASARIRRCRVVQVALHFRSVAADLRGLHPKLAVSFEFHRVAFEASRFERLECHMYEKSSVALEDCSGIAVAVHASRGFSGFSGLKCGDIEEAAVDCGMLNSVRLRRVGVLDWSFYGTAEAVIHVAASQVGAVQVGRRARVTLTDCTMTARSMEVQDEGILELDRCRVEQESSVEARDRGRLVLKGSEFDARVQVRMRDEAFCEIWKMARPKLLVRDESTHLVLDGNPVKD